MKACHRAVRGDRLAADGVGVGRASPWSSSCPGGPDTTAPTIDVTLSRDVLWPPNREMSAIATAVDVHDARRQREVGAASITSDEPDNGLGDGDGQRHQGAS
jgi:hypothetical protein